MFERFETFDIATSGTTIHGRRGGVGSPVLLLHGIPETHLMWHRVAPRLAERFTVVAIDLRGFGDSGTPPSTSDHTPYSMREIARDQVEVMRALGYDEFSVAGHDRGARCAYRMALDHCAVVTRLAVLDIVPTGEAFRRADRDFSLGYWVWSFLAAPEPVPERLIAQAPDVLVNHMLDTWSDDPNAFPLELRAEYIAKFSAPETIHAICEEYRAAGTLDYWHDENERGRRRITCPTLALWSSTGAVAAWYQPLQVWREWCDDVRGGPITAGHFLPEEPRPCQPEVDRVLLTGRAGHESIGRTARPFACSERFSERPRLSRQLMADTARGSLLVTVAEDAVWWFRTSRMGVSRHAGLVSREMTD